MDRQTSQITPLRSRGASWLPEICKWAVALLFLRLAAESAAQNTAPTKLWEVDAQSASAATVGLDGTIYFGTGDAQVYALNRDGTIKWKGPAAGGVSAPMMIAGSLRIVVSTNGVMQALDWAGESKWIFNAQMPLTGSCALGVDETIYLPVGDPIEKLCALGSDGSLKWREEIGAGSSAPVVGPNGMVICGTGDGSLAAWEPGGSPVWRVALGAAYSATTPPAIGGDGTVFMAAQAFGRGTLFAVSGEGKLLWSRSLGTGQLSSPVIGMDGTLYLSGSQGGGSTVWAIAADGSTERWHASLPANSLSSGVAGSDGNLLFCSGEALYGLSSGGALRWTLPLGAAGAQSPAAAPTLDWEGKIYASAAGKVYCLRGATNAAGTAWPMAGRDLLRSSRAPHLPLSTIRTEFAATESLATSFVATEEQIFIGGIFQSVGIPAGGGVVIDRGAGLPLRDFPRVNGKVLAVVEDGSGGCFIGGSFTLQEGPANLAHILANGTVDRDWSIAVDGEVRALARDGELLYAGGNFQQLGEAPRNYLGAVNAVTAELMAWAPEPDGGVNIILSDGDPIYIGGDFSMVHGQSHPGIAALPKSADTPLAWKPNLDGEVISMARLGSKLYVGGYIQELTGKKRQKLLAIEMGSGAIASWTSKMVFGVDQIPETIVAAGCAIYVYGDNLIDRAFFTQPDAKLNALDATTGAVLDWQANPLLGGQTGYIHAIALADNALYIAGAFTQIGGQPRNNFAALDLSTAQALPWDPQVPPPRRVDLLSPFGVALYAGGDLLFSDPKGRDGGAVFDAKTGKVLDWSISKYGEASDALAVSGTNVYFSGGFFNTSPLRLLGAFDRKSGTIREWDADANGTVNALIISSNLALLGGNFTMAGGKARTNLAAVDASTGLAADWNPGANNAVEIMVASESTLYAAGSFTRIGGQNRNHLAAFEMVTGGLADWNPAPSAKDGALLISCVVPAGDVVYVGGAFSRIGGQARNYMAALDKRTGKALAWNPNPTDYVDAIAVAGGAVFVSGGYFDVGTPFRLNLTALDLVTGRVLEWRPDFIGQGKQMVATPTALYLCGQFNEVAGQTRSGFATFRFPGSPEAIKPANRAAPAGASVALAPEVSGLGPLQLQWYYNGKPIENATNGTLSIENATVSQSGGYSLLAGSPFGYASTIDAQVAVFEPPQLLLQPQGQEIGPGAAVTLSALAKGEPGVTYQWRLNGMPIPGANGPTFTIPNAQPVNSGTYGVVVANVAGGIGSEQAKVVVQSPELPFSDNFAEAGTLTTEAGIGSGRTVNATHEAGEGRHAGKTGRRSVWISWVAPSDGIATVSTRGSGFDTLLGVYTGAQVSDLSEVAGDDDSGGFFTSQAAFYATAGTIYRIAVDGFGGQAGNIVFTWNLEVASAVLPQVLSAPKAQTVTRGGDAQFEVRVFSPIPEAYQWYHNCLLMDGETNRTLQIGNVQSGDVGVYSVQIRNQSGVAVQPPSVVLEIGPAGVKAQTVDKFADLFETAQAAGLRAAALGGGFPIVSAGVGGSQNLNNFGATVELGEPVYKVAADASRWYMLTSAADGTMVVDTAGSKIATILGVFSGTDIFNLTTIGESDDGGAVRFHATKGEAYMVVVAGRDGAEGEIVLNWILGDGPVIANPPASQLVPQGQTVAVSVSVSASPAPKFAWFKYNSTSKAWARLRGQTSNELTYSNFGAAQVGQYRVEASNAIGTTTAEFTLNALQPLRLGGQLVGEAFKMQISGGTGAYPVLLEASSDLAHWSAVWTNPPSPAFEYSDPLRARAVFYRAGEVSSK